MKTSIADEGPLATETLFLVFTWPLNINDNLVRILLYFFVSDVQFGSILFVSDD